VVALRGRWRPSDALSGRVGGSGSHRPGGQNFTRVTSRREDFSRCVTVRHVSPRSVATGGTRPTAALRREMHERPKFGHLGTVADLVEDQCRQCFRRYAHHANQAGEPVLLPPIFRATSHCITYHRNEVSSTTIGAATPRTTVLLSRAYRLVGRSAIAADGCASTTEHPHEHLQRTTSRSPRP
jgi:hypothetical protein